MGSESMNHKISRIYEICMKVWPEEFQQQYSGRRAKFNDWLNEKTGLNEDHIHGRDEAIIHWLAELEFIIKERR